MKGGYLASYNYTEKERLFRLLVRYISISMYRECSSCNPRIIVSVCVQQMSLSNRIFGSDVQYSILDSPMFICICAWIKLHVISFHAVRISVIVEAAE